ncbi:hypothetical protein [Clostridium kluyveri]|nr:hypothetical protein [Clostridium kluyveri]
MILEDIYKEFNNFPSDIMDEIDKHKFKLKNINNNYFLDEIWKITIDICKKYIEAEWIKNLGIKKSLLTEDIKFHSILNIYLSIINKDLKGWSLDECADDYYTNICCSDKYSSKDLDDIIKNLKMKFPMWFQCNKNCSNNYSDFYRCFYEDILEKNRKKDTILIYIYPEIFYTVIDLWRTCPYNPKKLHKINLKQLSSFHEKLHIIITKTNNEFDKIIKSYIIERLFNISYIHTLYEYMIKLYKQEVNELNDYIKKQKDEMTNFYKKH